MQATDRATGNPKSGGTAFLEYGYRQWRGSKYELVDERKMSASIGADGYATFEIDLDRSGSIEATVSVADSKGRKTVASAYLWVWERGTSLSGSVPSLQVVLDRNEYEVGDTAMAIIRTSRPGGSALVTIEADGILSSRVVPLDSESVEVEWKLEFVLSVRPEKRYYLVGQTVVFIAKAEYYTGEPVVGAKVNASIFSSELWDRSPFEDDSYYDWDQEEWFGGAYLGQFDAEN